MGPAVHLGLENVVLSCSALTENGSGTLPPALDALGLSSAATQVAAGSADLGMCCRPCSVCRNAVLHVHACLVHPVCMSHAHAHAQSRRYATAVPQYVVFLRAHPGRCNRRSSDAIRPASCATLPCCAGQICGSAGAGAHGTQLTTRITHCAGHPDCPDPVLTSSGHSRLQPSGIGWQASACAGCCLGSWAGAVE